jgi:hypothetical protein
MTRGQQNLYYKLLRAIAEKKCPKCGARGVQGIMDTVHDFYKHMYNDGKTTTKLSKAQFSEYYTACQKASIEMFGVSGMDEDDGEFDHGFPK